jgi:uncharacterized repeat protein (TIGR01451 family)
MNRPLSELVQPVVDKRPSVAASTPSTSAQRAKETSQPGIARASSKPRSASPQHAGHQPAQHAGGDIVLTGATVENAHAVQPAPPGGPQAIFTPAEPRVPLTPADDLQMQYGLTPVRDAALHPECADEFLFDGGDRNYPYHYEGRVRAGLDSEDAVIEYMDHRGRPYVKPTNRVAIYAPRFGAVRMVTGPETDQSIDKAVGAMAMTPGVGLENRVASIDHTQRDQAGGIRMRERASGLDSDSPPATSGQITLPVQHTKFVNPHEDLLFVKTGQFIQTEQARLAIGIQAAAVWSRTEFPVIMAETSSAQEVKTWAKPMAMIGTEDMRQPGDLRIVKLADKQVAQPGDEITFTIRYDNIGDRELRNIRIIDNLTPRLEYVLESAQSEREGKLIITDNDEGSVILTFEVAQPLPGHEGGAITFKTRVK